MIETPTILAADAMGTRFEFVLMGTGGDLDARGLLAAGESAMECIHETEERWSLFRAGSRLATLNRSGHERPLALDLDDVQMFETIQQVVRSSAGAFDPNVARQMRAAGHFEGSGRRAMIGEEGESAGQWHYDPAARTIRFSALGPALDLGAVAKGHALDLAMTELQDAGVACALLHGGQSAVLGMGAPPGQSAWSVRVGEQVVALKDRALAFSRSDAQVTTMGGHLLNPRTCAGGQAQAVPMGRRAAVTAPTVALADAWATALCVDPQLAQTAAGDLCSQAVDVLLCDTTPISLSTRVNSNASASPVPSA
jgi:thiamine biosynthesis lipoprotein